MPANNNAITTDQSNVPTELPQITVTPQQPPTRPGDRVSPVNQIQATSLVYPLDRPKYYIAFDIYNYGRQSLLEVGKLDRANGINQIILPLPSAIQDMNAVRWEDNVDLGMLTGAAADAIAGSLRGVNISSIRSFND